MTHAHCYNLSLLLSLGIAVTPAVAQDQSNAQPTVVAAPATQPTAPKVETPADIAFKPIQKKFETIFTSLQNMGGVIPEDRPVLEKLRERFVEFGKQFPDDERGIAGELTISRWLGDDDRVEACYERLLHKKPNSGKIRLAWAKSLKSDNHYRRAAEVLQDGSFDDALVIEAMHTLSDCLYADDRHDDSLKALESIPASTWEKNPDLKLEIETLITQRKEYVQFWEKEQQLRLEEDAANNLPLVRIATSRGPIVVALFENEAPNTVANFIDLVGRKSYDDTRFHSVIPTLRVEGGDPNTRGGTSALAGQGTPGYYIADEFGEHARKQFAGTLAMARSELPNTGGCNFMLTLMPNSFLNGRRTVFGRVIEGLDVVRALKKDDVIETMTILRRREHAYTPVTLPLDPSAAVSAATQPLATPIPVTINPSVVSPDSAIEVMPVDPTVRAGAPANTQPAAVDTPPSAVPPQ